MIRKLFYSLAAVAVAFALPTGCEKSGGGNKDSGGGGGGGGNSSVVGLWNVTSWRDPADGTNNANTGFTFTFNSDGSFAFRGVPAGSYSTSGNKITGSGSTAVGKFDINFTVSGKTLDGGFYEHWAKKTVGVTAVKQ